MPFTKILEIPIYGHFSIKIWGLMVAIGMIIGLKVAIFEAKRKKLNQELISDLFVWIVLSSIIGSRILYIILFWKDYISNPLDIFKIWEGGMVFYGGVIAAIASIYIFCKKRKIKFWNIADILAPGFAIGIFFGRIGCFLIGDHIGAPTNWLPFGSYAAQDPSVLRHEVSAYLSINGLIAFVLLWNLRKKFVKIGQIAYIFLIYDGTTRFFLDYLRASDLDGSDPRFYSLTISQWISIALVIFGIMNLHKTFKSNNILNKIKNIFPTFIILYFILYTLPSNIPTAFAFSDLPENHEHKAAIEYLNQKGIIEGYSDDTVKPDQLINRAEALKVILEGVSKLGITLDAANTSEITLSDISESDWFYSYVLAGIETGLIEGYEDNTFKGTKSINLAEALKIIFKAFKITSTNSESQNWYDPYVIGSLERKLIELENDGQSHPEKKLSRGDLFEIIYRLLYIRENQEGIFDISLNWQKLSMPKLNFELKYPFDWTLQENQNDIVLWHQDTTNHQIYYFAESPLSAYVKFTLDQNEANLSADTIFKSLFNEYCIDNCTQNLKLEIPTFTKTNSDEKWFKQEQYLYLPNKKILILTIEFGKDKLEDQFMEQINYMIGSLKYIENTEANSGMEETLSLAYKNIQIDGQGMATINMFTDAIIILTDAIGVGAGPVDYYYSESANITLKYLREYDTILDIENGKTSNF